MLVKGATDDRRFTDLCIRQKASMNFGKQNTYLYKNPKQ